MDKKYIEAVAESISTKKKQLREEMQEFIKRVFDERHGVVGLPDWLHSAAEQRDDLVEFNLIYCSYNHDGAWIRPYVMRREETKYNKEGFNYYLDGRECEEYAQEWMDDLNVDSVEDIYYFLIDYFESGIDDELDDLRQRLANCHRMGDVEIICQEWAEAHDYDWAELSWEKMLEWHTKEVEQQNKK